jgi:hypothetical protein
VLPLTLNVVVVLGINCTMLAAWFALSVNASVAAPSYVRPANERANPVVRMVVTWLTSTV